MATVLCWGQLISSISYSRLNFSLFSTGPFVELVYDQLREIRYHDVRACRLQSVCMAGPVDADDTAESSLATGLDAGNGVFHNYGSGRVYADPPSCLEK
jgi:hypothetical protein